MIAKKIVFTGKVQGVSFRFTTEKIARNFKVFGYVKNLLKDGKPYSGDKVELFLQGDKEEIDNVIKLVGLYFGSQHIKQTQITSAKVDKKIKDFSQDRTEDNFYWKNNPPARTYTQSDFGFGYKPQTGAVIPIKNTSPVEKECTICHFMTGRRCPNCGMVVCGFCLSSKKHVCRPMKNVSYDASRFYVLEMTKMSICSVCGKIETTLQCKTCKEYVCSGCGSSHTCKISKFVQTTAIYLCSVCKKERTSCQCNSCKRAVCPDCQGNHDCKKKVIDAPKKDDFDYIGNCVSCSIKTTRVCKDCGKPLCSICEDTIIDCLGNSLHDCKNQNVKKTGRGFVQSVRAALGF